jgi:hypothetical protein
MNLKSGNKMNRNRTYRSDRSLKAWIQRRCIICQRFLSIFQVKYCNRCIPLIEKKQDLECSNRLYQIIPEFREERKLRAKVFRNADRFNVGDIV